MPLFAHWRHLPFSVSSGVKKGCISSEMKLFSPPSSSSPPSCFSNTAFAAATTTATTTTTSLSFIINAPPPPSPTTQIQPDYAIPTALSEAPCIVLCKEYHSDESGPFISPQEKDRKRQRICSILDCSLTIKQKKNKKKQKKTPPKKGTSRGVFAECNVDGAPAKKYNNLVASASSLSAFLPQDGRASPPQSLNKNTNQQHISNTIFCCFDDVIEQRLVELHALQRLNDGNVQQEIDTYLVACIAPRLKHLVLPRNNIPHYDNLPDINTYALGILDPAKDSDPELQQVLLLLRQCTPLRRRTKRAQREVQWREESWFAMQTLVRCLQVLLLLLIIILLSCIFFVFLCLLLL